MKKRILALALCLVMAVSLLPVTAAARVTVTINSMQITASGLTKGALWSWSDVYQLDIASWNCNITSSANIEKGIVSFIASNDVIPNNISQFDVITEDLIEGQPYYLYIILGLESNTAFDCSLSEDFSALSDISLPGYEPEFTGKYCIDNGDDYNKDCAIFLQFSLTKKHEHDWRFTVSESGNILTAECQSCDTPPMSVELKAHSVTLPDSPFNARLEGQVPFETATGAAISNIRYDYKGSDGVWHKGVDPVPANAKAGTYQAFVQVSNLPRPVETDGVVAMAENPDGTYTAELYVQYTAVDPAVTAQTGDSRPIELMMASVLVFSALAAAAFILDNKRKYSR